MSTTTLVDLTDAQMLDYNMDGDFSMHNSPAEWLTVEATMSDDNPVSALTDYSEPIEIDMEAGDDGDGDITEYEMADDAVDDLDYDGDAHLQDVEVDGPLPEPEVAIDTPHVPDFPFRNPTEPPHIGHAESSLSTQPTEHYAYVTEANTTIEVATVKAEALHLLQAAEAPPFPTFTAEEPSAAVHVHEDLLEVSDSAEGAPHEVATPEVAVVTSITHTEHPGEPSALPHDSVIEDLPNEEAIGNPAPENFAIHAGNSEERGGIADDSHEPEVTVETSQAMHPATVEDAEQPLETAENEGDPHEISDGVYIDPPPAVLLTLSTAGSDELCLFNHPRSSSRSQSPEAGPSSSISADSVLLQQRPTLYYESLTDVFGALRQEESIHSLSDFASFANELTLEAYDLGLSFSEDNIYTHEVTLHDLNVIHDDAHLTGPLRLRLSSSPRFIIRYRALRDQIAQMGLGAPEDNNETTQSTDEAPGNNTDLGNASKELPEPDEYERVNGDEETTVNQQSIVQVEAVPEEASNPADDALEDELGVDEVTDAFESRTEYGTEVTAEEAAEGLDSDEIHRAIDAEDGGDYTNYAENVEDDDEQFGESIPEELGSSVDEATDAAAQHEIVEPNAPTLDVSTQEEDTASEEPEEESHLDEEASTVEKASTHDEEDLSADLAETAAEADNDDPVYGEDQDDLREEHLYDESDLYEDENWDEDELEDGDTPADPLQGGHDDTISKQSSETLSTLSSKRSRDDDDEEEDILSGISPESPNSKRARTH